MAQTQAEKRMKMYEREMHKIYEAWDYHLIEKLEGADRIARIMISEFRGIGIPFEMFLPFIQQKFQDILALCAERYYESTANTNKEEEEEIIE